MPFVTHRDSNGMTISVKGEESHDFNFDAVLDMDAAQDDVYEAVAAPVLEDVLKGYNGTIFAYGQTGSGKTFTMEGPTMTDPKHMGVIPRVLGNLFAHVFSAPEHIEFLVKASLVEIYMEKIRDLFNPSKVDLKVREEKTRGIWIEGAEEIYVSSPEEALECLRVGQAHRAVTSTKMNNTSSRSHSIFIISLMQKNTSDGSTRTSKFSLVDLAGSEKIRKTGAEGQTLEEAKMINKSLSALGMVINSLTDGKSTHIPYRDSKLTRILQESLGGNSRTALCICVSPANDNEAETTSTCRFGARAKSVKNHAKMNLERSPHELKMLLAKAEKEIERQRKLIAALEEEIDILKGGGTVPDRPKHTSAAAASGEDSDGDVDDDEIGAIAASSDPDAPIRTRGRAASHTFELELRDLEMRNKELEGKNQEMEEELVVLEDEKETLREEMEEKEKDVEDLEEEKRRMQDKVMDLEEDVKNSRAELEGMKLRNNEVEAELEAEQAQNKLLKEQVERLKEQGAGGQDTPSSLTAEVTQLIPELREDPEATKEAAAAAKRRPHRSPSVAAAEEAAAAVAAAEGDGVNKLSDGAAAAAAPSTEDTVDADDTVDMEENEGVDLEVVRSTTDVGKLQGIVEQQHERMQALVDSRNKVAHRRRQLEREVGQLKSRMQNYTSDYAKWKAAVLVDLRARIDRNIRLEISLDETRERYESLLNNSKDPSKKRLHFLEQSVQCLTRKCQETQKQLEGYVSEAKVHETKMHRKNERIKILELLLNDARERNEKLRIEVHQARGTDPSVPGENPGLLPPPADPSDASSPDPVEASPKLPSTLLLAKASPRTLAHTQLQGSRVAKPIRGGSAGRAASAAAAGGGDDGEGGTMQQFSSWFKRIVK